MNAQFSSTTNLGVRPWMGGGDRLSSVNLWEGQGKTQKVKTKVMAKTGKRADLMTILFVAIGHNQLIKYSKTL